VHRYSSIFYYLSRPEPERNGKGYGTVLGLGLTGTGSGLGVALIVTQRHPDPQSMIVPPKP